MIATTSCVERVPTPLGEMLLVTDADGRVRALEWDDPRHGLDARLQMHDGHGARRLDAPSAARRALTDYFAGDVDALDAIAVAAPGTPFQQRVWAALRQLPAGTVRSYAWLAHSLDRPSAVRAVARANATNPVALIVGCHRIIGSNGALTGYAGGLERKRWLLEHEARAVRARRARGDRPVSIASPEVSASCRGGA